MNRNTGEMAPKSQNSSVPPPTSLQDVWNQKVVNPANKAINSLSNAGTNISNAADQLGQGNFSNAYSAINGVNPVGQQSSGSGLQGSSSGWNFTSSLGD
jgi:hypothetical protein